MPDESPVDEKTLHEEGFPFLDEYLRELHAGRQPDRAAFLKQHPELADALNCIEALDQLIPAPPPSMNPPAVPENHPTLAHVRAESGPEPSADAVHIPDFGDYELLEEIGRGGMGIIWKARQKKLDRLVAIKMILANHLASRDQVERFAAEARAMAKLHHPHIVRVIETGQAHGQHYFVMEYIAGSSLADLARTGPLPPERAARYVATVARAVAHLHEQGIVHRDLKPSNILLDENDQPYVTDFGLAKLLVADSHMTATGAILGTPAFMAPEQAAGHTREVGPLSDVYSLGAILYTLLTNRPPFHEENPLDTLVQVIEGEPTRPCWLNPEVPPKLEMICLKCLEKSPGDRYASATALAEDLERYLNDEEVEARPPGLWPNLRRWSRREPALASRLVALVALVPIVQINYQFFKPVTLALHVEVVALLALWAAASVLCQRVLNRNRGATWIPGVLSTIDALLLIMLLRITDSQNSPLLIGFPFLIAASGLWFRVRTVWVTTAIMEVAYAVLVIDATSRRGRLAEPHHYVIFMVALAVLGFVVAYQVQRIRALSHYYEHRPLP
jgi:serine/threonine-protein kinase